MWVSATLQRSPVPNNKAKQPRKPKAPLGTWAHWQNTIPSEGQIKQWFSGTDNGVGLLTGFNGTHYIAGIDFDLKDFESEAAMSAAIEQLFTAQPRLRNCQRDRSRNGGIHIYVAFERFEDFKANNGFALAPNQTARVGELICGDAAKSGTGGHIILAPSQGYTWENWHDGYPEIFESPQAIGLFPLVEKPPTEVVKAAAKGFAPKPTTSVVVSKSATKAKRYSSYSDFLERCLKPAYLQLPLEEQYVLDYCDPQLKQQSASEWRGFNPFGDEQKNPEAFSVKLQTDGMTVWRSFSTEQSGNVFEYLCLKLFATDTAKGANFFKFIEFLSQRTGIAIPDYLDADKQKRDRDDDLAAQLTPEQLAAFEKYPHHTPGGVRLDITQIVLQAVFAAGWIQAQGILYQFNGKYYQMIEDDAALGLVFNFLNVYPVERVDKKGNSSFVCEYANYGTAEKCLKGAKIAIKRKVEINHLICFNNCLLDMRDGSTLPHSAAYHVTSIIDAPYNRAATDCPVIFHNFISDAFGLEYLTVVQAMISMYLDPTCFYGKAVHLLGKSGGGKGTLQRFVASLFDPTAVSALGGFEDIAAQDKRHQNLQNKRFVYFPDVGGFQKNLQPYYELVDNGSLSGRKLHSSDGYTKVWNCRFMFGSVSDLKIENSGDGWARRTIVLRVKDTERKTDYRLGEKLQTQAVKAGVIGWALSMDRDQRDAILQNPESVVPAIARDNHLSSISGDTVKTFIDRCFARCDSEERISTAKLYAMYLAFAKASGAGRMALNSFTSHLKTVLPENFRERSAMPGNRNVKIPAGFVGMFLIDAEIFAPDSMRPEEWYCDLDKTVEGSFYTEFHTEPAPTTSVVCAESGTEAPTEAIRTVDAIAAQQNDTAALERVFTGLCAASPDMQAATWQLLEQRLVAKGKLDRLEGFRAIAEKAKGIYATQPLEAQASPQTTAQAPAIEYAQPPLVSSNPNMF